MSKVTENKFYIRLPINVKIYNKNNELVQSINSTKKSVVRLKLWRFLQDNENLEWYGRCRVWYSRKNDMWNESVFTSYDMFDKALIDDTQKELLLELKRTNDIDIHYLSKRRLSDKQRRILKENASKSPLFKKLKKAAYTASI